MKKKLSYSTWAVLYIICAALGFVEEPEGFGKFLLTATGIIFFLPPFYLLLCARQERDQKTVRLLRLISICILCLSLVLIVLNFLSVYFDAYTGLFLHVLLVLFTAPMICSQYWALALFLWACLLMVSLQKISSDGNSPVQK